jgi:hypothetical protein
VLNDIDFFVIEIRCSIRTLRNFIKFSKIRFLFYGLGRLIE